MNKLLIALAATTLLSACGHAPITAIASSTSAASAPLDAQATDTLTKGFRQVYMAVFSKLDANEDGFLDEYEGSVAINLKDFQGADSDTDGKLSKAEFLNYATGANGIFGFLKQTNTSFLKQARNVMLAGFTRLDKNNDRLLEPAELSAEALTKVDMNLEIGALHVNVHIKELDDDIMTQADHTGDGNLSQAEWEDYCLYSFTKLINPAYNPTTDATTQGTAPAADPTTVAPDPGADSGT